MARYTAQTKRQTVCLVGLHANTDTVMLPAETITLQSVVRGCRGLLEDQEQATGVAVCFCMSEASVTPGVTDNLAFDLLC